MIELKLKVIEKLKVIWVRFFWGEFFKKFIHTHLLAYNLYPLQF